MEKRHREQRNKAVLMRSLADSNKVQTLNLLLSAVVDIGETGCVNPYPTNVENRVSS